MWSILTALVDTRFHAFLTEHILNDIFRIQPPRRDAQHRLSRSYHSSVFPCSAKMRLSARGDRGLMLHSNGFGWLWGLCLSHRSARWQSWRTYLMMPSVYSTAGSTILPSFTILEMSNTARLWMQDSHTDASARCKPIGDTMDK